MKHLERRTAIRTGAEGGGGRRWAQAWAAARRQWLDVRRPNVR